MSNGKKRKTPFKRVEKRHGKRWRYKVLGGRNSKPSFKHFRHQKWFKTLDTHISMRKAVSREIWFWD